MTVADVIVRYPTIKDAPMMHGYINKLSGEKTFISLQGEHVDPDVDKKFLTSRLQSIKTGKSVMLIALLGETMIGQAEVTLKSRNKNHVGELSISVGAEYRGKGIGFRLVKEITAEATKKLRGLKKIVLEVYTNNKPAIGLYVKRCGFIKYGVLPQGAKYRNNYVDVEFMYKDV